MSAMQRHGDRTPGARSPRVLAVVCAVALSAAAAPAAAQIPWESPLMASPGSPAGMGLFIADWGLGAGDGVGFLATWRSAAAPGSTGVRAGAARSLGDPIVLGGVDYSVPVFRNAANFPLDVIWLVGAGAAYGEYLQVAAPVGFATGRPLESGALWLNPYLSGRLVFEAFFGEEKPEDDFGIGLAIDIGADVAFDAGRDFVLRLGASLGDRHALIAGVHVRM